MIGYDEHGPAFPYGSDDTPELPKHHPVWDQTEWDNVARPRAVKCPACLLITWIIVMAVLGALFFALTSPARAFDHGFDPLDKTTQWMESLQRPDYRPHSCCGVADAYQADIYKRNPDGSYDIEITDGSAVTFPDGSKRTPLANGTKLHVSASRVNNEEERAGNPTGHAWLFVSVYGIVDDNSDEPSTKAGTEYCFTPLLPGS